MGKPNNTILLASVILIFFTSMSCSKLAKSKETRIPAPLFDGLYLEYKEKGWGYSGRYEYLQGWEVYQVSEGFDIVSYMTIEDEHEEEYENESEEEYEYEGESGRASGIIVDPYGRIKQEEPTPPLSKLLSIFFNVDASIDIKDEKFSPIWIPTNEFEIGDSLEELTIVREDTWKSWNVLVAQAPITLGERYFELETGYLVGMTDRGPMGKIEKVLVDTNAEVTVAEGF